MVIWETNLKQGVKRVGQLHRLEKEATVFESLAHCHVVYFNLSGDHRAAPERVRGPCLDGVSSDAGRHTGLRAQRSLNG